MPTSGQQVATAIEAGIAQQERKIAQHQRELSGLERDLAKLKAAQAALNGTGVARKTAEQEHKSPAPQKGKRNLSPAARKKISDAVKKRWAEHRKAKAKE